MFLFGKRQQSSGERPGELERLQPNVLFETLREKLRKQFGRWREIKAGPTLLTNPDIEQSYAAARKTNQTDKIQIIQYRRRDGRQINLASPVNDYEPKGMFNPDSARGQLRDAVLCIIELQRQDLIGSDDISFIPLSQLAEHRGHFILLVMQDRALQFIDSKGPATASLVYPIEQFQTALTHLANEPAMQLSILPFVFMGHQSLIDETKCGYFVKSYCSHLAFWLNDLFKEGIQIQQYLNQHFIKRPLASSDMPRHEDFLNIERDSEDDTDDAEAKSTTAAQQGPSLNQGRAVSSHEDDDNEADEQKGETAAAGDATDDDDFVMLQTPKSKTPSK